MKTIAICFGFVGLTFIGAAPMERHLLAQTGAYDLPNDDTGCPANCRQIPWKAGSDLWNGGTLPVYTPLTCPGLTEGNETTDNGPAIQACLNSAGPQNAVLIPPGMYYVNTMITIPSNTVLRGSGSTTCSQGRWLSSAFSGDTGAGSTCTTLKLGALGTIRNAGYLSKATLAVPLSSGFQKGSRTIVTSSAPGVAVNDWIIVSQQQGDTDPPVTWNGGHGTCTWCGENDNAGYVMSQIVQVTSVSGNTIGISRPLYYSGLMHRWRSAESS